MLDVGALCAACSQWCPRRTTLVVPPFNVDLAVYHLMSLTAVAAIHIRACGRYQEISVRPMYVGACGDMILGTNEKGSVVENLEEGEGKSIICF